MSESKGFIVSITDRRARIVEVVAALGILAACAVMFAVTNHAGAAGRTTVVLGKTNNPPNAACPQNTTANPCQAIVRVTGFQLANGQTTSPFRVPFDGKVTSWSVTVGQPTNVQRSAFNNRFGRPPEAHISILKRVPGTNPVKFKLRSQSPLKVLTPFLGQTVQFKLSTPLRVLKNNIVAISVPTWAPAFSAASNLVGNNTWRASRAPGKCGAGSINVSRPQQVKGSRKVYGCLYKGSRLLYTATVVSNG